MWKISEIAVVQIVRNQRHFLVQCSQSYSSTHSSQSAKNDGNGQNNLDTTKPFKSIPGPSIFQLFTRFLPGGKYHKVELIDLHRKMNEEYGAISKFPGMFGNKEVVMIYDSNDFEMVFRTEGIWPNRRGISTFDHYRRDVRPDIFKNNGGLLNEQGEPWGKMRSMVSPIMLKPATVNAYIPVVDEIATEFCDYIHTLRDDKNELPANFLYELNKWALESISSIALDQRLHILKGAINDPNSESSKLIKAVDDFFLLSFELEMLPSLWRYVKTSKYKELMAVYDTMTHATLHYIDQAIEKFENNPSASDENREQSVFQKLLKIDKQVAVVMALDMMLAGVDTTSSTTANFLYHIAKNPEKQEILRQELQSLPVDTNGKLTSSSFLKAPYLRACLKEIIRLSPIIAGNVRAAGRDLVIQGYQVPKGTDVAMSNVLHHYSEEHFKNPNEFIPERWLKDDIPNACPEAKASNPFVYLPFGFGPRSCVGKRLAEMELNVLLTRLLKKYRIEFDYGPFKYRYSFVMSPISDLKFKLSEI